MNIDWKKIWTDRKIIIGNPFVMLLTILYVSYLLLKCLRITTSYNTFEETLYKLSYFIYKFNFNFILILVLLLFLIFIRYKINWKTLFSVYILPTFCGILFFSILITLPKTCYSLLVYSAVLIISVIIYYLLMKNKDVVKDDLLQDSPISSKNEDLLGRDNFINTFVNIIKSCNGSGNRILLSGTWGIGKTSILNCVKEILDKDSIIWYREVNPWANDNKEKFARALLYEIDNFSKNTFPYLCISEKLENNLLRNIASFSIGPIQFNLPKESDNIYNNIKEMQEYLKYKKEKLVIVIDDLDRLNKQQILNILGIIYIFSTCNNIIFIISANINQVEDILTEAKDSCNSESETEDIRKIRNSKSYFQYLEKMASNVIKIPIISEDAISNFFINQIDKILQQAEVNKLTDNEKQLIPIAHITDLRMAKRILQSFKNSFLQPKVRTEVNPLHFLLITILFLYFPDIYFKLSNNRNLCVDTYLQDYPKQREIIDEFCNNLLQIYPKQKNFIKDILFILNPNYRKALYTKQVETGYSEASDIAIRYPIPKDNEIEKAFYSSRYIDRYFVENFSENIISDKILDDLFNQLAQSKISLESINILKNFIINNIEKIQSFFSYIYTTHKISRMILNSIFIACAHVVNEKDNIISIQSKNILLKSMITMLREELIDDKVLIDIFNIVNSIFIKSRIYITYDNIRSPDEQKKKIHNALQQKLDQSYPENINMNFLIEECYKYWPLTYGEASNVVYLWGSLFKIRKKLLPSRKQIIKDIIMNEEKYFWFLAGKLISCYINDNFPYDDWTHWSIQEMVEITDTLLKKENLKHRKEIAVINEYYRQKIEPIMR